MLRNNQKEPYDLINTKLLNRVLNYQDYNNSLYVKTDKILGEFFLEGMETRLHYSDQMLDKIEKAEDILFTHQTENQAYPEHIIKEAKYIYFSFLQAHNHELFHFYQVLSLPAFQVMMSVRKRYIEIETVVMMKHFEAGKSFRLGEHVRILDIVETREFELDKELAKQINEINEKYDFYVGGWQEEIDGISLFYIIESMAHIMSLQLSETPQLDRLSIEESLEYLSAYKVFLKYLDMPEFDIRFKYLLFIYICYFSCQVINRPEDADSLAPVRIFHSLCSRLRYYVEAWKKLFNRYERYSKEELFELLDFGITKPDIENQSESKIGSILAFFELIPLIKDEADKMSQSDFSPKFDFIDKIKKLVRQDNVIPSNIYEIAHMAIFPAKFVNIRYAYDRLENNVFDGQEFKFSNETNFYRFIVNCKKLLSCCCSVPCCEEHGEHENIREILSCKNDGGFAFYSEQLLKRPAIKLFEM